MHYLLERAQPQNSLLSKDNKTKCCTKTVLTVSQVSTGKTLIVKSSVAITSKKSTDSKKGVNEQVIKRRHGIHDANSLIKDVQNIDRGKDKKVTLACKRGEKL